MFELIVVEPFKDFKKGDVISDKAIVKELLSGEFQNHFVKKPVPVTDSK